jgi:hypothetical protein
LPAERSLIDVCTESTSIQPPSRWLSSPLWLVTLQRDRPFTFLDHALKCGDSLLGVSCMKQIETSAYAAANGR